MLPTKTPASFGILLLVLLGFAATASLAAETNVKVPTVVIQNRYKGCQPRVECAPYEDDVLFRYKEEYKFNFDVNPKDKSITCTAQCTADGATTTELVTFVGGTRGTSTKTFQWRLQKDGGFVSWKDSDGKVLKGFFKVFSF